MSLVKIATPSQESAIPVASLIQERQAIAAMVEACMRQSGYHESLSVLRDFHEGIELAGTCAKL